MRTVLGIDPGVHGAFAILDRGDRDIVLVDDLPVFHIARSSDPRKRNELNLHALKSILGEYPIELAVIEQVTARPGQGVTSMFRFGFAAGSLFGLLIGLNIPVVRVTPQTWQRFHHIGPSPDAARQLVLDRFPDLSASFKLRKDEHRADAVLLADYGLRAAGLEPL